MQHSLAQHLKGGASIHLPLETLQFIHLALGLPIAVGQRQGGSHGIEVSHDACGQALEFSNAAALGFGEPSIQDVVLSPGHHDAKVLR